jgi:hypothetical protein
VQEGQEIFVRAHAPLQPPGNWFRKRPQKWPEFALVFDTETTLDAAQKLTFGCFRRYQLSSNKYTCIEEGLFHSDHLSKGGQKMLRRYVNDPTRVPGIERSLQARFKLISRARFISHVFWRAVRNGDLITAFNLPFDISRLAVKSTAGHKGDWSLVLSMRKSRKTGEIEKNRDRPRIVITSINSKTAFFKLSSNLHKSEWPNDPRFLDLRTLTWALRNKSYTLKQACKEFKVAGKLDHLPTGRVTYEEIDYCREDVAATARLLNAAKKEFNRHPLELYPDQAYSPASIAKAYLDAMNIQHPKKRFKVSGKNYGTSMQSYYGGRAECRIRKTHVPVVLTDFTSQYPTVNALLGNWNVLTASQIRFEVCTGKIRKFLSAVKLEQTFDPAYWKQLPFFALVKPAKDILPVRTIYNGRTQNIGLNYLVSPKAIWYAGPDLIASTLLTGRTPKILKAVRMVSVGQQKGLVPTNLSGIVAINPIKDDFFVRVIEQRNLFKRRNKSLSEFWKLDLSNP